MYILYSESFNRFYVGQTRDVAMRLQRHNRGSEPSTASYRPWRLVLTIEKPTRSEAVVLERKLKNLNHVRLQKFISKYG